MDYRIRNLVLVKLTTWRFGDNSLARPSVAPLQ